MQPPKINTHSKLWVNQTPDEKSMVTLEDARSLNAEADRMMREAKGMKREAIRMAAHAAKLKSGLVKDPYRT